MFKWLFTRFKRPKPSLNVKALEEQLQKPTWLRGADLQIFQPLLSDVEDCPMSDTSASIVGRHREQSS